MAIYTRTGDKGLTSLMDTTRVLKSHDRVETYGTIDELNSAIGVAIAELITDNKELITIKNELDRIQNDLMEIGSALADPRAKPLKDLDKRVKEFEKLIDQMTEKLPELRNFILPGGGKAGSLLHLARTISRRAERRIVALIQNEEIDQGIIVYINRLSDLLFTMSRFVNQVENKKETIWGKKK